MLKFLIIAVLVIGVPSPANGQDTDLTFLTNIVDELSNAMVSNALRLKDVSKQNVERVRSQIIPLMKSIDIRVKSANVSLPKSIENKDLKFNIAKILATLIKYNESLSQHSESYTASVSNKVKDAKFQVVDYVEQFIGKIQALNPKAITIAKCLGMKGGNFTMIAGTALMDMDRSVIEQISKRTQASNDLLNNWQDQVDTKFEQFFEGILQCGSSLRSLSEFGTCMKELSSKVSPSDHLAKTIDGFLNSYDENNFRAILNEKLSEFKSKLQPFYDDFQNCITKSKR